MAIKDRVKRVSKIFSSESKESLDKQLKKDNEDDSSVVNHTTTDLEKDVDQSKDEKITTDEPIVHNDEEDIQPVKTTNEEEPTKSEDVPEPETETNGETEAPIVDADAEGSTSVEPESTETTTVEEAKDQVKKSSNKTEKAIKKNDFFKKLLLKFKKPASTRETKEIVQV